jgi:hypothetical protein
MPPVWSEDDDSDNAAFDPDKAPPDPPETLNLFETQPVTTSQGKHEALQARAWCEGCTEH